MAPAVLPLGIEIGRGQLRRWPQRLQQMQAEVRKQLARLVAGVLGQAAQPYQAVSQQFDILTQPRIDGVAQV